MTLHLSSPEEVEKFAMGIDTIKMRYEGWLQTRVTEIVREEIITPLHNAMRSHNYSDKIIEGTDISEIVIQGKRLKIKIKSEYFAKNGFDVALAREKGTKPHWVEPLRVGSILAESDPNIPKALHWTTRGGEDAFSKGHITGGIEARGLVEMITNQGREKVIKRIRDEFVAWRDEILKT